MIRRWFVIMSACIALISCKGETKVQEDPQLVRQLDDCHKSRMEKDKYITQLKERLADYELGQANSEMIVTIEGNAITLKGKGGAPAPSGSRAPKQEHIRSFIKQVQNARGLMQRCYQNALKKDDNLQVRPVTMNIEIRFTATGKVGKAAFKPRISNSFSQCMSAVATRWKVPGAPTGVVFRQPITLSPE